MRWEDWALQFARDLIEKLDRIIDLLERIVEE